GRPRELKHVRELARQHTKEAIATLVKIMHNEGETGSARARAAEAILDRAWGRAPATMELTGAEGGPIKLKEAKDDLASIIASIAARQGASGVAGEPH
ncbi:MAG: hypothetical protein GY811_21805, partial [Myxococcales bacterium]|nr:hypothetical protein [Myxococcales bacterium]